MTRVRGVMASATAVGIDAEAVLGRAVESHDARAEMRRRQEQRIVGGALDQDLVTGRHQHRQREEVRHRAARGGHDLCGAHGMVRRNPLEQRADNRTNSVR